MAEASQASSFGGASVEQLLPFITEVAKCLCGAQGGEVRNWQKEHVENAFGWAEYLEHMLESAAPEPGEVHALDDAIRQLQQEHERSNPH